MSNQTFATALGLAVLVRAHIVYPREDDLQMSFQVSSPPFLRLEIFSGMPKNANNGAVSKGVIFY